MKITRSINELLGLHNVLNELSRRKVPFSIALAKNIKVLKPVLEEFEKGKQEFIEENAMLDEDGKILGKLQEAVEGTEPVRIANPQTFQDIEWKSEGALEKVLEELNNMGRSVSDIFIYPIDADREYFDSLTKSKIKIRDYIDREIEASMVLYLDDLGLFKNLYEVEVEEAK